MLKIIEAPRIATATQEDLDRLAFLAFRDSLTGLYNRNAFEQERRATSPGTFVVYMDVNGLKAVNDSRGHAAGDLYLQKAAAALSRTFRRADDLVFRISGDEFIAFTSAIPSLAALSMFAVGSALIRDGGFEAALTSAEAAMYQNKRANRR